MVEKQVLVNNTYYKFFFLKINYKSIRLDYLLVILLKKFTRSFIKRLIKNNFVLIDGKLITEPDFKMIGTHHFTIKLANKSIQNNIYNGEDISFKIIYEDNDIIIVDKPINLVVHPGGEYNKGTLLNGLIFFFPTNYYLYRAGLVHRLDKNASGLIIIAKHKKMQCYLMNLFKYHKIVREYQVIVYGKFDKSEGIINLPLGVHPKYPMRRSVRYDNKGKPAKTKFIVQETFLNFTRLLVKLYTGRTHQIRVHLAYIQHPVVGDFLYGKKINNKLFFKGEKKNNYQFTSLALQSTKLGIYHIMHKQYMEWELSLSKEISKLIELIKKFNKNKKN